jgi:hypothetical protein
LDIHNNNTFATFAAINLRLRPGDEHCDTNTTSIPIDQLADVFQTLYNHIVDDIYSYSPCDDEAYSRISDMKHIETVEYGDIENERYGILPQFSFRRKSDGSNETGLPSRIDYSLRGNGGRRMSQEKRINTRWRYVSILFEVTVACRGIFCIGDNAELFQNNAAIEKTDFTKAYAEHLDNMQLLWEHPYSNCDLPNDDDSGATSSVMLVNTVREFTKEFCPAADDQAGTDSIRNVIVELLVSEAGSVVPFADPNDPRFAPIEEAYVFTYNQLNQNEFCDPFFRRARKAKVVAIGAIDTNTNMMAVEMNISMEFSGNMSSDVDIYDTTSSVMRSENSSSSSAAPSARYLTNITNNISNEFLLPSIPTSSQSKGRTLRNETCFCDAQPFGRRAPFEAEFVSRFKLVVDALDSPGISTANSCKFRTKFATGVVLAFSKPELRMLQESGDDIKSLLEVALKDTFNELLAVTDETCNTDFRVVETVEAILGPVDMGYSVREGNRDGERNLRVPLQNINVTYTSSNATNCTDIATNATHDLLSNSSVSMNATNFNHSNSTSIICSETNVTKVLKAPVPVPNAFDFLALDDDGDSRPVLFFISGECSGCENSLLTGFSNDAIRRLKKKVSKLSRELRERGEPTRSNCFCPLNATKTNEKLDASITSEAYEENLKKIGISYNARFITEVDVVLCDKNSKELNTAVDLALSRNAKETLGLRGICDVVGMDNYYRSYFHIEPSSGPSDQQTEIPTEIPSRSPISPTNVPTWNPTKRPSKEPTRKPTRYPTQWPTPNPSKKSTLEPTPNPTVGPTEPTGVPTKLPTEEPTGTPTQSPTTEPIGSPTQSPTTVPTGSPTQSPTTEPTGAPTQ